MFEYANNDTIRQQVMLTFTQCADRCKEECIFYVKTNALNSGLWMIFASMFFITLYYYTEKNDDALRLVADWTKQSDTEHIRKTLRLFLVFGIGLLALYIIVFLISLQNISPIS